MKLKLITAIIVLLALAGEAAAQNYCETKCEGGNHGVPVRCTTYCR